MAERLESQRTIISPAHAETKQVEDRANIAWPFFRFHVSTSQNNAEQKNADQHNLMQNNSVQNKSVVAPDPKLKVLSRP